LLRGFTEVAGGACIACHNEAEAKATEEPQATEEPSEEDGVYEALSDDETLEVLKEEAGEYDGRAAKLTERRVLQMIGSRPQAAEKPKPAEVWYCGGCDCINPCNGVCCHCENQVCDGDAPENHYEDDTDEGDTDEGIDSDAGTADQAPKVATEALASPVVPTNVSGISKGPADTRRPHPVACNVSVAA
jgi:hypothetical protein